jgi:glycosyltransferase involved in cell wall biosynthesis
VHITDAIFASDDPGGLFDVPLTHYQIYCIQRFRMDREVDVTTEAGRMRGLMWCLEGYGVLRRPLATPFSARQVRWMLQSASPYLGAGALPRIVEAFWRRSKMSLNPASNRENEYLDLASWWALQMAPHCGVEFFLIPDAFIDALKSFPPGAGAVPENAFLKHFMSQRPDIGWLRDGPTERLANYIRVLCEPLGRHFSLFFPTGVLEAIAGLVEPQPRNAAILHLDASDAVAVATRAREALEYAARHRLLRSGRLNISAPLIGQDWITKEARPPRKDPQKPPRELAVQLGHQKVSGRTTLRMIGPLNSQSGLGQATRMSVDALVSAGREPELIDFYLDNPAPRVSKFVTSEGSSHPGAINVLHLNAESIPLAPAYLKPQLFEGAYNIGYFFWELPQPARCHALALEMLDEIWVSSEFNREGYQKITSKPVIKMGMAVETLPIPGESAKTRAHYGLPLSATVFMTTFDSYSFIMRKNPAAALRSFLLAFGDRPDADVRMVVKTHNMTAVLGESGSSELITELQQLTESDPRILVIDRTMSFNDLLTLKSVCDCYVSLHRSEGWGFGALEAMQLGLPVIVTGFSGNLEFCTPETAYLVPYKSVFLNPSDYIFVQPGDYWAEADINEAARMMRCVYEAPEEARARGSAARSFVEEHFSVSAVGARYDARLRDIEAALAVGDKVR